MYLRMLSCMAIFAFWGNDLFAQYLDKRPQAVFFEVLGTGVGYSVNYDTRFQKTEDGLGGRAGVSYFKSNGLGVFSLPVGLNYLLGKNGNYFEVGAGATFLSVKEDENKHGEFLFIGGEESTVVGTLVFGYRRQPVEGGFTFRAGVSPIIGGGDFIPWWPHVGFGYAF